jgi:1,4-alpha-glucan branching enzyme
MPFVRHPEYKRFLEEDWLFESINESYLPLLRMLNSLRSKGVNYRLTICLSPTLITMLQDTLLQERFIGYLELHRQLGELEVERCSKQQPQALQMAQYYLENIRQNLEDFDKLYDRNILTGFKDLMLSGYLELITSAATNAFLPLYQEYPIAVNAQIMLGIQTFHEAFGQKPQGFWLPECGYYPGLDKLLSRHGIRYFPAASQSILFSPDRCDTGVFRPVYSENDIAVFPRDYQLTSLVWSDEGYPSDPAYREFYRDIGYDLDLDYIRPFIHEPDVRVFTGFKYWAITGKGADKVFYDPAKAKAKVEEHASNFLYNLMMKGRRVRPNLDGKDPLITLCFDAELFGHWWFEGIDWLETFLTKSCQMDSPVELTTPSQELALEPRLQKIRPAFSSWGAGGFAQVWLDGSYAWAYRHIHKGIERMIELADRFPSQQSLKKRFLDQATRELLLAMSSDWAYLFYNHNNIDFAKNQLEDHLQNFNLVYENMCKNAVNTEWLVKCEDRDNIFPSINYNIFNQELFEKLI